MPSEQARMPAETWESLRTRGRCYCPAMANEVRELPSLRRGHGHTALSAVVVALWVLAIIGWAVMLTGGTV